jgi:hypothetical protein
MYEREKSVVLICEILVVGATRDACSAYHIGDRCIRVASLGEQLQEGIKNPFSWSHYCQALDLDVIGLVSLVTTRKASSM